MSSAMDEIFDIVDENNVVIGTATRKECHGNPKLLHRTAHVIVFDSSGRILLQKRSMRKDIQPGKWDTAVGGHLDHGESFEQAAVREMKEELGVCIHGLEFMFDMKIRNEIESENVRVFSTVSDGPFQYNENEIEDIRFWTTEELSAEMNRGTITPSCMNELSLLEHRSR